MKDNSYFITYGWMINRLKLKGTALMVYAIVYGFSQSGRGECEGGISYIADSVGCTRQTAIKALQDLEKLGLIIKKQVRANDGGMRNHYKVDLDAIEFGESESTDVEKVEKECGKNVENKTEGSKNFTSGVKKIDRGMSKKYTEDSQKNRHRNIYRNKDIELKEGNARSGTKPYGEFKNVYLNESEYTMLKDKYGNQLKETLFSLSSYMESTGIGYRNHYAALYKWCEQDSKKHRSNNKNNKDELHSCNLEEYKSIVNKF